MTQKTEFRIVYDGEALKTHSMDVRDLAPALLAFGRLFDESNRVINGNQSQVKLKIKATTPGSFDILFLLDHQFTSQISNLLTGTSTTSLINLVTLLGFAKGGQITFLALIRRLKGERPSKIKDLKNGFVQIEIGKEVLTVPIELLRLYQDVAVRKATEAILEPLKKDGISKFESKSIDNKVIETITEDQVSYYSLPQLDDELLLSVEHEAAYSIITLAFKEDNKWRLYDGSSTISVTMEDSDFQYKVDNNLISFTKGDVLLCRVKTTQYMTDKGLKTEYEVLKVKKHSPAARQLLLFEVDEVE